MGAFLGRVERDRQHRLGPIQRLDLGLLIDREHHGAAGRLEIEPDDIGDLLRERRVLTDLEGARVVRLDPGLAPQLRHVVMRHVDALGPGDEPGHLPARPVRQARLSRRAGLGHRQDPGPDPRRNLLPRRPTSPVQQPGNTLGIEATQPQIHRRSRHPRQRRNLLLLPTFSPPQHDPRPGRDRRRHLRAGHHRPKLRPLIEGQLHPPSQHQDQSSRRKAIRITRH